MPDYPPPVDDVLYLMRHVMDTDALLALPREDRDLFIAATNGRVLAFDNASGLPAWISDTLCRLATGGRFAVHQLYSDKDEVHEVFAPNSTHRAQVTPAKRGKGNKARTADAPEDVS